MRILLSNVLTNFPRFIFYSKACECIFHNSENAVTHFHFHDVKNKGKYIRPIQKKNRPIFNYHYLTRILSKVYRLSKNVKWRLLSTTSGKAAIATTILIQGYWVYYGTIIMHGRSMLAWCYSRMDLPKINLLELIRVLSCIVMTYWKKCSLSQLAINDCKCS